MKILYIHHGRILGGAPVSLSNMMAGIQKAAPDIELLLYLVYSDMSDFFLRRNNLKGELIYNPCLIIGRILIGYMGISSFFNIWRIVALLREILIFPVSIYKQYSLFRLIKPDIIHLNSSILFTSAIAARLAGIKLIWHVREMIKRSRINPIRILASALIKRLSDKVVVINPEGSERLGNSRRKNVEIVYNSIDFDVFKTSANKQPDVAAKYSLPTGKKIALSLGGVSYHKGTVQLLKASQYIQDDIMIVVAGLPVNSDLLPINNFVKFILKAEDFLIRTKIKKTYKWYYSHRAALLYNDVPQNNIKYIGMIENVVELLDSCSLLVFAGTTPHFPRPVYEAWAMKKPVVAFEINGVKEHIVNNKNGILVRDFDSRKLATAINVLIAEQDKAAQYGEMGYEKSKKLFCIQNNTKKILDIYHSIN